MKKEISPAVMFGVIGVVLVIAGFFVFRAVAGDVSRGPSDMGKKLSAIMERTGGDTSKMSPEEQKFYDEAIKSGYYRPGGSSGNMSSSGRPVSQGYAGNSRGPGSSESAGRNMGSYGGPGSSGGYPGSSGGYPGSSGGYPTNRR